MKVVNNTVQDEKRTRKADKKNVHFLTCTAGMHR